MEISAHQGSYTMVEEMVISTSKLFNWLRKPVIVCCNCTVCVSLFHSVGETIAKPYLPMTFLEHPEERGSRFPGVRLLVFIKDDKYVGCENVMTLNVMRLYLNKMLYEMGRQCKF